MSYFSGDISDLYNMKINSGDLAAFSNDCSATSKRLSRMKVKPFIYLWVLLCFTENKNFLRNFKLDLKKKKKLKA